MSISRGKMPFERDFVQIPNAWMRDKRLSRRARGLLAELMTHEPGWKTSMEQLIAGGPEGRDAIRAAIKELENAGYLRRARTKSRGRFDGYDYMLCDPSTTVTDFQATENPHQTGPEQDTSAENQSTGNQSTRNPPLRTPIPEDQVEALKNGDGASAARKPGTDVELPGMPSRTELAVKTKAIEAQVAEWVYEQTGHGLKYMAMHQMAKEAMAEGYSPKDIAKAMVTMYRSNPNGTVTRAGLFRYLQGHGTGPARPSATEQRVSSALDRAAEYRRQAQEAAS